MNFKTFSSRETKRLAARLARQVLRARTPRRRAWVITLSGDLGTGKTTFIQGFCRGLGLRPGASPTFIFLRRQTLRRARFKNVYHADLYRLQNARELAALGWREVMREPGNIVLIEWPERAGRSLSRPRIRIRLRHGQTNNERIISISNRD